MLLIFEELNKALSPKISIILEEPKYTAVSTAARKTSEIPASLASHFISGI
jgi:hypothetical protein